ncbi:MAG: cysteine hydrolase [Dactylosporangium sp.]|nr:cysteine hydrolase [Dactylosporangium sp.]
MREAVVAGDDGGFTEQSVRAAAERAYREGRADLPLAAGRAALLVIDMQQEFVRPGWSPYWVPEATRIVPVVADLIEGCRAAGVPVIYTVFAETHHRLDRPRGLDWMPNHAPEWVPPPEAAEVWAPLAPRPDEVVIRKPSYGAFYDTPLDTILRRLERDIVILAGTLTNFCVGTTARQGYERGYFVVVAEDATATDMPAMHDAELATLKKGFALVSPARRIVERLDASTETA